MNILQESGGKLDKEMVLQLSGFLLGKSVEEQLKEKWKYTEHWTINILFAAMTSIKQRPTSI